jgi:hypothetical protein
MFIQVKHGQCRFSKTKLALCRAPGSFQSLLEDCIAEKVDCIAVDRPISEYPLAVQLGNELSTKWPVFVRFFKPPERERISFSLAVML